MSKKVVKFRVFTKFYDFTNIVSRTSFSAIITVIMKVALQSAATSMDQGLKPP